MKDLNAKLNTNIIIHIFLITVELDSAVKGLKRFICIYFYLFCSPVTICMYHCARRLLMEESTARYICVHASPSLCINTFLFLFLFHGKHMAVRVLLKHLGAITNPYSQDQSIFHATPI